MAVTTFDDQAFQVFGPSVNLGTLLGSMSLSGHIANFDGRVGTFTEHVVSVPNPGVFSSDQSGGFICPPSGCLSSDPVSFIGDVTNLMGSAVPFDPGLPSDLVWTGDGAVSLSPSAGLVFIGRFALNAFQPQGTPASPPGCMGSACNVTVATDTTFFNSQTNTELRVAIDVTFADVASGGTTTITSVSNAAGQLATGFSLGGLPPTFFDVSTTAQVRGPISICSEYPDADDDGIVDGTGVDENSLALLHSLGGPFVDVTTSLDTAANVLCGSVSSLSPFVVAVRSNRPPDCTGAAAQPGELWPPDHAMVTVAIAVTDPDGDPTR